MAIEIFLTFAGTIHTNYTLGVETQQFPDPQ